MGFASMHFVINPAAGQPKPILRALNDVLYPRGIAWDISITKGDGSGKRQARAAVEAGADLIVAYGGDGTVKDVANGLIGGEVPLAVLHGGTGNALAYELGIPVDLEEAVTLLVEDHQHRSLDVGKAMQHDAQSAEPGYFMLRAGIGLQTDILAGATRDLKDRFGNLAYVMASLRSLAEYDPVRFEFSIDDEDVAADGLLCIITNSASIGGPRSFRFAAEVDPCDGELEVFVLDASFEGIMQRFLEGDGASVVQQWNSRDEIMIQTPSPLAVTLDGEPFGQTPVTISIIPQALQVVVPVSQA